MPVLVVNPWERAKAIRALKRRRVRVPVPREPRKQILQFSRALAPMVALWTGVVRRMLLDKMGEHFIREDANKTPMSDTDRLMAAMRVEMAQVVVAGDMARAAEAATTSVVGHSETEMARTLSGMTGVEIAIGAQEGVAAIAGKAIVENVNLIESIPARLLGDVEKLMGVAAETGMRVETLEKRIEERFGVTQRRARLIARDQTLKLNGDLAEARQLDVGISKYTWSTSRDERVRDDHRELEGTMHEWTEPPVVDQRTGRRAHPGRDYNCRCVALPDTDGLLDQLEASA